MGKVLGKFWIGKLLLLACFITLPIFIYYDEISFNSAKFTEEWIKMIISGFIFYIIFKMFDLNIAKRTSFEEITALSHKIGEQLNLIEDYYNGKTSYSSFDLYRCFNMIEDIGTLLNTKILISDGLYQFYYSAEYKFLLNFSKSIKNNNSEDIKKLLVKINKLKIYLNKS